MLTHHTLLLAYEASLRGALVERLQGDDSLLPTPSTSASETDRNIRLYAVALFNDMRREVPAIRRRLHYADEYLRDGAKARFEPKLSRILAMLEAGDPALSDPANSFLSPTVEHVFRNRRGEVVRDREGRLTVFQDYMLYEWGIHHFHVEEPRHKHLLFAMLRGEDAYILKIGTHGQTFDDPSILAVADRHWPHLLPQLHGFTVEHEFTPAEIHQLRRANGTFVVNVNGKLVPPLEGRATDGTPIRVTQGRDYVAHQLRTVADGLAAGTEGWARDVLAALGGQPDEVQVALYFTPVPMAAALLLRRGGDGPCAALKLRGDARRHT